MCVQRLYEVARAANVTAVPRVILEIIGLLCRLPLLTLQIPLRIPALCVFPKLAVAKTAVHETFLLLER